MNFEPFQFFNNQQDRGRGFRRHSAEKIERIKSRLGRGETQKSIALNECVGKSTVGDIARGIIRGNG